jgi:hypothetical protein
MAAPSKYAILRLGGVRQMLQEGLLYTCPKSCLLQQQQVVEHFSTSPAAAGNGTGAAVPTTTGSQRSYVLSNVLGLHNGQEFTWGSPYLPNTQVEVEVVEEFQGPTARSSMAAAAAASIASTSDSSLMTIYRVKHIRAAV